MQKKYEYLTGIVNNTKTEWIQEYKDKTFIIGGDTLLVSCGTISSGLPVFGDYSIANLTVSNSDNSQRKGHWTDLETLDGLVFVDTQTKRKYEITVNDIIKRGPNFCRITVRWINTEMVVEP